MNTYLCAYRGGGTHRPPAIFHGILLPSAHATLRARQNARRRRDARFYLSAIYLPTRALLKRGTPPTHDPAGDRFEKLLIVLFWIRVPRHSSTLPILRRAPFMRAAGQPDDGAYWPCERTPFARHEGFSRRCESMGGDKPQKVKIESTLSRNEGRQIKMWIHPHACLLNCESYKSRTFKLFNEILRTPAYLLLRICISWFINIHIVHERKKNILCVPWNAISRWWIRLCDRDNESVVKSDNWNLSGGE